MQQPLGTCLRQQLSAGWGSRCCSSSTRTTHSSSKSVCQASRCVALHVSDSGVHTLLVSVTDAANGDNPALCTSIISLACLEQISKACLSFCHHQHLIRRQLPTTALLLACVCILRARLHCLTCREWRQCCMCCMTATGTTTLEDCSWQQLM